MSINSAYSKNEFDFSYVYIWILRIVIGDYGIYLLTEPKNDKHCVVIKRKDDIFEWKSKECDKDEKNYICQYNHHCPVGYATVACTKCDRGTYKDSVTTDACSPCPATRTTTVRGSDSVDDCGEYTLDIFWKNNFQWVKDYDAKWLFPLWVDCPVSQVSICDIYRPQQSAER